MRRESQVQVVQSRLEILFYSKLHLIIIQAISGYEPIPGGALSTEVRTARLTILIDPRKKALFERLCAAEDANPSQVVRRLIRRYIEAQLGRPWTPAEPARWPVRTRRGRAHAR
jgi:hypothetical protein